MEKMIYDVFDKPKTKDLILTAVQHFLSVIAATIVVPMILDLEIQVSAAILGAGLGTLIYVLLTKRRSPIFISSNFSFIPSMGIALTFGYCGIIIGVLMAATIYILAAIIIRFAGTKWIDRLIPAAVIGPIVVLIGLSLAPNAVKDMLATDTNPSASGTNFIALLCAIFSFLVVVITASQNKFKGLKLIPFILGIAAGYVLALIFSIIGKCCGNTYIQVLDLSEFTSFFVNADGEFKGITAFIDYPKISLIEAIKELKAGDVSEAIKAINPNAEFVTPFGILTIALAFLPVSFVGFAEHIADHKNMSYVIGHNLLEDPGLSRTMLGDGLGSIVGTLFGVCPNTTYGESIACVAQSRNASTSPVILCACFSILCSFVTPLIALIRSIPTSVIGGVCIALYGYISLSGLNVIKSLDLHDEPVFFTIFAVLIIGVGGMILQIPLGNEDNSVEIPTFACALTLGIITYHLSSFVQKKTTPKD